MQSALQISTVSHDCIERSPSQIILTMNIFANKLNKNFLRNVLPGPEVSIDWVKAAIAYGDDETTLIQNSIENRRRLDIWVRYDQTVPVAPRLLRLLLESTRRNVFCYVVPDVLHSKVIWWKNHGVYIGSANLTERAWVSNIEMGVFVPEVDLESDGTIADIEGFFEALTECEEVMPLTDEIVRDQERLAAVRSQRLLALDRDSERLRTIPRWEGPAFIANAERVHEARKTRFTKEWTRGLTILRDIGNRAPRFKPSWLNADVPAAWQADQFLHAYYYNQVVDGARHPFEEYFVSNQKDPAGATEKALKWWSKLEAPPSNEDVNCHHRAPKIQSALARKQIGMLDLPTFKTLCQANHSTVDHVRRMRLETLGLQEGPGATEEARVNAFAEWIWAKRNQRGETIGQLLSFVLDGGISADMPGRLFDAAKMEERKFPHFGTNQLAELAGWARPEVCPPRNGRTSKALRALGHEVRVY